MPPEPVRVRTVENLLNPRLIQSISRETEIDEFEATSLLLMAGNRLAELLRSRSQRDQVVIEIDRQGGVRVAGVGGLVRLAPGLELEVVPKFLDEDDPRWREDFFLIASLVESGHLLPSDRLRASRGSRGDLASLVGRAMVTMYWDNHRRPLRSYERRNILAYEIDGEVEPVSIVLPDPEGFAQTAIILDRSHELNALIHSAAEVLIPEIRDRDTRLQLLRVKHSLQPQASAKWPLAQTPYRVPARHSDWQPLVDLSVQVLRGFGADYSPGPIQAPGFVVRTWTAWQSLCGIGLEMGLPTWSIEIEPEVKLGSRSGGQPVITRPDFVCHPPGGDAPLLVDAKYKGSADSETSIRSEDLYESLAFMEALGVKLAMLAYPLPHSSSSSRIPPGSVHHVESIVVDDREVMAIQVECRGISELAGLADFAANFASGLLKVVG